LPQKWRIWFAVEGDLRFASHHDMMRLLARLAARAHLPVGFSQGFNPRPLLSLPCPRPVGVASRCELLVICLDEPRADGEESAAALVQGLSAAAPEGLRFLRAEPLTTKAAPQPRRIDCERPVTDAQASAIRRRLDELAAMGRWPVDRKVPAAKRGEPPAPAVLDIRPLVTDVRLAGGLLRWSHVGYGGKWARPGEVLALLSMGDRADLASVTRTHVEYDN